MVITSEIGCRTGTVRGQAKKNNVSIPRKTGKSTIVTHGMIRVKKEDLFLLVCIVYNVDTVETRVYAVYVCCIMTKSIVVACRPGQT